MKVTNSVTTGNISTETNNVTTDNITIENNVTTAIIMIEINNVIIANFRIENVHNMIGNINRHVVVAAVEGYMEVKTEDKVDINLEVFTLKIGEDL